MKSNFKEKLQTMGRIVFFLCCQALYSLFKWDKIAELNYQGAYKKFRTHEKKKKKKFIKKLAINPENYKIYLRVRLARSRKIKCVKLS